MRKQLLSEYARANGTVERAAAEQPLRDAMTPEQNAHEHQARIRHARTTHDARTTASAPTFDDGFGIGLVSPPTGFDGSSSSEPRQPPQ